MQCTLYSAQWSGKALFFWDEPVFPWDEPSSALKGLPTPKRCRWWSRWMRWPWRWFPDICFFWGVCSCTLPCCVKADDDYDGVTLKDYEVEESGEYADCYHKTTQNCTFHVVCRTPCTAGCMLWFCDLWPGNAVGFHGTYGTVSVCHSMLHGTYGTVGHTVYNAILHGTHST